MKTKPLKLPALALTLIVLLSSCCSIKIKRIAKLENKLEDNIELARISGCIEVEKVDPLVFAPESDSIAVVVPSVVEVLHDTIRIECDSLGNVIIDLDSLEQDHSSRILSVRLKFKDNLLSLRAICQTKDDTIQVQSEKIVRLNKKLEECTIKHNDLTDQNLEINPIPQQPVYGIKPFAVIAYSLISLLAGFGLGFLVSKFA